MTFSTGPRAIIVDASVAVEIVADEGDWSDRWRTWRTEHVMLLAPPQFRLEVANALVKGGKRAAPAVTALRLDRLFASGIEIVDRGERGLVETIDLAERHGLTVYDATYIELASAIDAEVATLDRDLARAARAEGLVVHD